MCEIIYKLYYKNDYESDWSESEMSDDDDSTYYPSDSEEDCMSLASEEEDSMEVESTSESSAVSTETESSVSEPPSKYARLDFEIPEFEIESKGKI